MDQNYRNAEDFLCDESFQRYCLGTDPSATAQWEEWMEAHPEAAADIAEAKKIFAILNGNQGNLQEQAAQLKDGIGRSMLLKEALQGTPKRTSRYISIAAAFVALLGLSLIWKYATDKDKMPVLAATIQSGNEPRKTLVLSDGSVLTMRNNSTVSLSEGFGKNNRILTLSGEAFFDVKPDPAHPFIVHTKDVSIEVLGTVFNVSAYPENVYTETALFRGKVSVTSKTKPEHKTILTPNQKLVVYADKAKDTAALKVRSLAVDPQDHKAKEIAWVRSRLKIQDESLEQIAIRLQEWYGIQIVITDEAVKQYSYSGTFESETVIKALEALQLSYPFNFQMEQSRIVISK
ncbi:FecR family protein [Chitinophaga niabensis]|uniref:Ferric-dicitrate binding protein FerR, regulates iron transport through sigma-19 n=1 Tax=Chitinophaga niabensis TaxID=536979 RepID=A0A1N6GQ62_9BACT|nr:FecR domain-containing protein [Chitinophaga niabensis]SIO09640.1 ferric-dicitrate binding protein FerR, regulates iron transport through sigma-19 [Chitinophaga niabensis]